MLAGSAPLGGGAAGGRRAIVVAFTDFKPDGPPKARAQVAMVRNWVRHMRRLRVPCLVAICEEQTGKKARSPR